jgi:hypothetical protein
MSTPINLADPSFEPSDEVLVGLAQRAFAGVGEAHRAALVKLRAAIATAREEALGRLGVRSDPRNVP